MKVFRYNILMRSFINAVATCSQSNMTLRPRFVVLVIIFFFSVLIDVSLSYDQVYLVRRNNIDYFRVGKNGCTKNGSACTSSATCERENGLCRCGGDKPTFRNPVIKFNNSKTVFAEVYGCVDNDLILRVGELYRISGSWMPWISVKGVVQNIM